MLAATTIGGIALGLVLAQDAGTLDAGAGPTAPVAIAVVPPRYPPGARAAGREGTVVVRLEIDETGVVTAADVVVGVDPELDAAAVEAARALRFQPARADGRPVRAVVDWRLEFKLPREPPALPEPPAPAPLPPAPPLGRLEGRVLVEGARRGVPSAALTVGVAPAGETDAAGRFVVEIPCGPHRLEVQAPRFDTLTVEVDACAGRPPLELRLARQTHGPVYETVVRTEANQPKVKLEDEELTKTPGTMGNPFRALESLPGVSTVQWPAPVYVVRGSNPGNTGFFLDEVRVPALFHLALGPSVIHPYFFQDLDFYPGGYPARFGRYVAGIVTTNTRAPAEDAAHTVADVRLFDAGALVSTPLPDGNGTVAVAARYSYTGALISLLNESVVLDYWDYQVRAERRLGPLRLKALVFGSGDTLAPKGQNEDTDALVIRFHRASLQAALPAGGGRILGTATLGLDHTQAPFTSHFPITVDATSVAPRLAYRRPGAYADVEIGAEGELAHYAPTVAIDRPEALDLVRARDARTAAAYASLTLRAGARLSVTPEIRFDSYQVGDTRLGDVGPRLSVRLAVADDAWIKGTGGRFTQTPSLPLQIPGVEAFGLGVYGLQSSWLGALGAGTSRLRALEVEVTGYVQRYVLTDVRSPTLSGLDPLADDFLARRDALSYGVELMVRRPLRERLHGWLSYTLSTSLRALGNGVVGPSDWDQRHVANLILGYSIGRYTVGGRAHLNTGRPYPVATETGYARLPTYYQIDLRADRRYVFKSFTLELYAELQNATLNRQVVGVNYDSFGQRLVPTSYLIVLPSIGVHGEM